MPVPILALELRFLLVEQGLLLAQVDDHLGSDHLPDRVELLATALSKIAYYVELRLLLGKLCTGCDQFTVPLQELPLPQRHAFNADKVVLLTEILDRCLCLLDLAAHGRNAPGEKVNSPLRSCKLGGDLVLDVELG